MSETDASVPQVPGEIPILILAAGASRRMAGADKLLERIGDEPLLRRQVARALSASREVYVTLPPPPHPRYKTLEGSAAKIVAVPDAAYGMSRSLRAGLNALPSGIFGVMVLLPDMPDIASEDIKKLIKAVDQQPQALIWRATTAAGVPGHPIVFHHSLFEELSAISGDKGGSDVVAKHRGQTIFVPLPDDRARLDLDTPQAWSAWRQNQKAGDP